MRRKMVKVIGELKASERTTDNILDRLGRIKNRLRRAGGVLKKVNIDRMRNNGEYWQNTIQGYGDYLNAIADEIFILQTEIAQRRLP